MRLCAGSSPARSQRIVIAVSVLVRMPGYLLQAIALSEDKQQGNCPGPGAQVSQGSMSEACTEACTSVHTCLSHVCVQCVCLHLNIESMCLVCVGEVCVWRVLCACVCVLCVWVCGMLIHVCVCVLSHVW